MRIKELAQATGVDVETIRYYEKQSLLRNNNYQDNDGAEVYGLAFTVDEIDYLDSKAEGEARRARDGAGEPPAPGAANSSRKARNERQPAHA